MTTFGRWWTPTPDGPLLMLVRHGQTAYNAERRFLGQTDVPLDEVGIQQAEALAEALVEPADAVFSSPLARARETARRLHAAPLFHDGLRELSQGALEGLEVREGYRRFPEFFAAWAVDPTEVPVPGGESLGACRDRAQAALEEIASRHGPGERVAIVTHQLVIASLLCTLSDKPLSRWRDHGVRNAAVSFLVRQGELWRVLAEDVRFDDTRSPGGEVGADV